MTDAPLGSREMLEYLGQVADVLEPSGARHTIVVVGGSLLAFHGLRQTTLDVDTVVRIDPELRAAVAHVAIVNGLSTVWLNDSAASFRPQTFVEAECELLLDRGRLRVLGAPLRQVFMMKLFAARARTRDYDDLVALGPGCGFESAEEAVELYEAAYPHEARDPHLVDYVRGLVE